MTYLKFEYIVKCCVFALCCFTSSVGNSNQKVAVAKTATAKAMARSLPGMSITKTLKLESGERQTPSLIFDIPLAYNEEVRSWVRYFQANGRSHFKLWLERSNKHLPSIQRILKQEGLPKDLAYMAMIESGFSSQAVSSAAAVGPWQFIEATGTRYGLKSTWWLDERRDFDKSTRAAAKYLKYLYKMFNAWHLVAAGYNAGENYIARLVKKHETKSFWKLAEKGLHDETRNYVPKLIAAVLIAKAPNLYGFRDLNFDEPLEFEHFYAPGGTQLADLADHINVTREYMRELNPELVRGFIPETVDGHLIRIPKGSSSMVATYFRKSIASN